MWLRGITHTGHVTSAGGAAVVRPGDRVRPGADAAARTGSTGRPTAAPPEPLADQDDHHRVRRRRSSVSYSRRRLHPGSLPAPDTNTKRCMPEYYAPEGDEPTLDWFHKYVVDPRRRGRPAPAGSRTSRPSTTTSTAPAWHYDDDELTKPKTAHLGRLARLRPGAGPHRTGDRAADRDRVPVPARHGRRQAADRHPCVATSGHRLAGRQPSRTTRRSPGFAPRADHATTVPAGRGRRQHQRPVAGRARRRARRDR